MPANKTEFIKRFLYQIRDEDFYWIPGTPPTKDVVAQASIATKDVIGYETHRAAFEKLAEVIDVCTAEELESKGHGMAARNATKHPSVIALTKLDSEQRAGVATAAAQGLAWMDDCGQWAKDTTLRNQIARRVMTAILVAVGRIKKGYESGQLAGLTRIGVSLQASDGFVLRARGAIVEILAGNISNFPRDKGTCKVLGELLDIIVARPNAQPALNAVDKLKPLTLAPSVTS